MSDGLDRCMKAPKGTLMSDPATIAADLRACSARYEPWVTRADLTHTCCKLDGHRGRHLCPTCQASWTEPRVGGHEAREENTE